MVPATTTADVLFHQHFVPCAFNSFRSPLRKPVSPQVARSLYIRPGAILGKRASSSHRSVRGCRLVVRGVNSDPDKDEGSDVALRKNPDLYAAAMDVSIPADSATQSSAGRRKPEVLAPAGGWDQARAAVEAGADAIYFGLADFNARARAANFDPGEELVELMGYLHENGVKGYVTMNVLVFDQELERVEERVRQMARAGVDAVIVQDMGVVQLIRNVAPNLPVHGSTQMSITSAEGVKFAAQLGVTRVVVGRELSVKEIRKVADSVREVAEVEAFVHGALCVSYSGQCFSSEAWGGRSANRGQCAQACRMPYGLVADGKLRELGDVKYLLSPQDLMAVEQVPELIEAGVSCFKIEGRLKGPEYVAITTQVYRRAIDKAWTAMYGHEQTRTGKEGADKDAKHLIPKNSDSSNSNSAPSPRLQLSTQEKWDLQQVFSRGQDERHDGLTPGFLAGVQHQSLVRGRAPRHRGVFLGKVTKITRKGVHVHLAGPVKRGDGVVFDKGAPEVTLVGDVRLFLHPLQRQESEIGGSVYEVFLENGTPVEPKEELASGVVQLSFNHKAVALDAVAVGDRVWRTSDPTLEGRIKSVRTSAQRSTGFMDHVNGVAVVAKGGLGTPLELVFVDPLGHAASVKSRSELSAASTRPMDKFSLRKGLGENLGGGALSLATLDLSSLQLGDGLFLPASEVKSMRREAVEELRRQRQQHNRAAGVVATSMVDAIINTQQQTHQDPPADVNLSVDAGPGPNPSGNDALQFSVLCRTREQAEAALRVPWLEEVVLDFLEVQGLKEACQRVRDEGRRVVVATPRILKPDEQNLWQFYLGLQADSLLVRSSGLLHHFVQLGGAGALVSLPGGKTCTIPNLRGDFSLNVSNKLSAVHMLSMGLERLTPTHDLNAAQLEELVHVMASKDRQRLECVIHQHLPIFHTEHCVFCRFLSDGNSYLDCGHPCESTNVHLRDNHGHDHLVLADMGCRNTVFNAKAQSGAYYMRSLARAGYKHFRVELVDEPSHVVADLLEEYAKLARGDSQPSEAWLFMNTLPDANGRVHGVTGGSLVTHSERASESLRPAGTNASDFQRHYT